MSLTDSAYWTAACKNSAAKETWLIQLYYDTESSFVGISDRDLTVTAFYRGLVKDFGSINESIDVVKNKANIGNVEIVCHNSYKGYSLAKELFGGSRAYINRKVDIYSRIGDASALADCQQIYQGRLYNVIYDEDEITLQIEEKTPADYIAIPNVKTYEGIYQPVIYGDYSFSASNPTTRAFCHTNIVHPLPVVAIKNGEIHCINHQADTNDNPLFLYETGWDVFVPMYPDNSNTKTHIDRNETTFNTIVGPQSLRRAFLARPISREGITDFEDDPDNILDTSTSTYAQQEDTHSESADGPDSYFIDANQKIDFANLVGTCTDSTLYIFSIFVKFEIYIFSPSWLNATGSAFIDFFEIHYSTGNQLGSGVEITTIDDDTESGTIEGDILARYAANNNQWPGEVTLTATQGWNVTITSGNLTVTWRDRIYDVYYDFDLEQDTINKYSESVTELEGHDVFYAATNGYDADYTGGSGTVASEAHEIFADMLDRFAGVDFDYSDASVVPGYSSLATDRSGWDMRIWLLEPTPLHKILEKIQYEGCFIFRFKPNGGKYIHIENSYASADATLTPDDWESYSISLTDFQDVVTHTTYNFNRHPADNRYRSSSTLTNSASRSTYWPSIATEENKRQVNLDYLVNCGDNTEDVYDTGSGDGDNAANESIAVYNDNLLAAPKIIINISVINKKYNHLELGDIIQVSGIDLFGYTAANKYFMIIETNRSVVRFNIKAREVQ